jgi:hypothetical protein
MKESGSFDFTGPGPVPALLVLFTQVHADTDKGVADGKRARLQGGRFLKISLGGDSCPQSLFLASLNQTSGAGRASRTQRRERGRGGHGERGQRQGEGGGRRGVHVRAAGDQIHQALHRRLLRRRRLRCVSALLAVCILMIRLLSCSISVVLSVQFFPPVVLRSCRGCVAS